MSYKTIRICLYSHHVNLEHLRRTRTLASNIRLRCCENRYGTPLAYKAERSGVGWTTAQLIFKKYEHAECFGHGENTKKGKEKKNENVKE